VTDRPIIFSAPMVRALLAGRKTQTRRLAKFIEQQPNGRFHARNGGGGCVNIAEADVPSVAPDYARYAVGDCLYVREHWRVSSAQDTVAPRDLPRDLSVEYVADGLGYFDGKHRQGMHMPRWASRLTLTVEAVRIERLQEISRDDAIAEGLLLASNVLEEFWRWPEPHHENLWLSPPAAYRHLWGILHTAEGERWDDNPFVVALTFKVERGNIDRLAA
jgi:hypothetical protein